MDGLRTEQHELLRQHRERALEVLLVASSAYTGTPRLRELAEGRALLRQPPELLVSVAVSVAAAAVASGFGRAGARLFTFSTTTALVRPWLTL